MLTAIGSAPTLCKKFESGRLAGSTVGTRERRRPLARLAAAVIVLALSMLAVSVSPSGAARKVAPRVLIELVANGGGNRLDVIARVTTGRPGRKCDGTATMAGYRSRLKTLTTGPKGGRQWHWYLGDGASRARLKVAVACRFPNGKVYRRTVKRTLGPGPYPRRPFRHVVRPGSLRTESWAPPKKYDGSGAGAELYPRGQCTWYAARQRPDLPYFPGLSGDAKNWVTSARSRDIPTGAEPRVGAIAVFQPGQYGAGFFGHVAYVRAVAGDKITVTEANYRGRPAGSSRTVGWSGVRFIYREALPPILGPPAPPPMPTPTSNPPQPRPPLDLLSQASLRLVSESLGDQAGNSVAIAGDMNQDGLSDMIVGAPGVGNSSNGYTTTGSAYVVFGRLGGDVALQSLGANGFRIDGGTLGDFAGASVAGAGDVNGDGRSDVIVGAPGANNNGRDGSTPPMSCSGSRLRSPSVSGPWGLGAFAWTAPRSMTRPVVRWRRQAT